MNKRGKFIVEEEMIEGRNNNVRRKQKELVNRRGVLGKNEM